MSFEIGDTIGTYKIVAAIGSGGMGEVFQVEHAVTKRVEAMKILVSESASTPEQGQRFLREIQLQARLNHPNIATVHNAFWEREHLVMIMELIQGNSLRTLLDNVKLPLPASLDYACQALAALDYAHANGVVHRDISPGNMIATDDGTLKVTDFGLAKSPKDVRLTQTGTLIGSLYYTSPEQVRGQSHIDARADIYSLGAVLFEMATGAKLFGSDNPFTLMLAHVEQPARVPSEVLPGLPAALDEILLKALDKDPEKRFQSAELFRCALEGLKDAWDLQHTNRPVSQHGFSEERQMSRSYLLTTQPRPAAAAAPSFEQPVRAKTPDISWPPMWRSSVTGIGRAASSAMRRMSITPMWHSPAGKIAAVLVFALGFSYVWKSAFFPSANPQPATVVEASVVTQELDFANLPVSWPSDFIPMPQLTYPPVRTRTRGSAPVRRDVVSASKYDSKPGSVHAAEGTQEARKGRNPFIRVFGRVAHPLHRAEANRSSAAAKVPEQP
ncbi:MAG: serine/threonine protein kinase [Bryobacterales bacterium]|nr:serine/threonine protein kinase [Bryobacterales bacterium]